MFIEQPLALPGSANNSVASLCSLSLTMVKTGAKLQIPGIRGGLVLIKMSVMN